jgi:hypothetical protein
VLRQEERDRIQSQIDIAEFEIGGLKVVFAKHEGWTGGNIKEELEALTNKIDAKIKERNYFKKQIEAI